MVLCKCGVGFFDRIHFFIDSPSPVIVTPRFFFHFCQSAGVEHFVFLCFSLVSLFSFLTIIFITHVGWIDLINTSHYL